MKKHILLSMVILGSSGLLAEKTMPPAPVASIVSNVFDTSVNVLKLSASAALICCNYALKATNLASGLIKEISERPRVMAAASIAGAYAWYAHNQYQKAQPSIARAEAFLQQPITKKNIFLVWGSETENHTCYGAGEHNGTSYFWQFAHDILEKQDEVIAAFNRDYQEFDLCACSNIPYYFKLVRAITALQKEIAACINGLKPFSSLEQVIEAIVAQNTKAKDFYSLNELEFNCVYAHIRKHLSLRENPVRLAKKAVFPAIDAAEKVHLKLIMLVSRLEALKKVLEKNQDRILPVHSIVDASFGSQGCTSANCCKK